MKQVLQDLAHGRTLVAEVPAPRAVARHLLVRTHRTLVSVGTERMLVALGKANLLDKARQQPDKVRQVLDKVRTDGLLPTLHAIRSKLDRPLSMGYSNVGTVIEVGSGVTGFSVGDRVASNGPHAEVVNVPSNLCARVPAGVSDDAAAFTVVGSIALQGIRLVHPTLGEAVVVSGLGLIGLLTVQLLRAHGCRVLGVDLDDERLARARALGAETVNLSVADPVSAAMAFSRGRGVDAVLIAASTESSDPVRQAARMCRKRGRIVLVGVAGLELSRADFYEKELSFQVSCSYGPGRYDPAYESRGQDYPVGFVRWTEQRNFEAVLDMLADGRIDPCPLITHRFDIDRADQAYALISGGQKSLAVLLDYPARSENAQEPLLGRTVVLSPGTHAPPRQGSTTLAFVGAGNYAVSVLIPAFRASGARLKTVVANGGVSGFHAGRRFGFEQAATSTIAAFADPDIDAVVIATRHDSHASLVCEALAAGKHVFVEKPLAIDRDGLAHIEALHGKLRQEGRDGLLAVGFNRRFSPHARRMRELLEGVAAPKVVSMTVNAGAIAAEHWTKDRESGGGRLIGEACHFVDLLRYLVGAPIEAVETTNLRTRDGPALEDSAIVTLRFADGSLGSVHYLANGHRAFPKERVEVFCDGRILQLDNFRQLRAWGWPGFKGLKLWRQDKGNRSCAEAFVRAVATGGPAPIPFDELVEVTRTTFEMADALRR